MIINNKLARNFLPHIQPNWWVSCDKIPSRYHSFDSRMEQLDHISQVTNFWLPSHNFGKVAIIRKFQYFPKRKRLLYGVAMLDGLGTSKRLSLILEILNFLTYSYFVKIMTRKPKTGKLTKMTELYPFLESKKWYLLFKGLLWSCDVKPPIVITSKGKAVFSVVL